MTLGHEWQATDIARYMDPAQYSGLQETVGLTKLAPRLFGTSPGDKQEFTYSFDVVVYKIRTCQLCDTALLRWAELQCMRAWPGYGTVPACIDLTH